MKLDPARIKAFIAANKKKIEEYYNDNKTAFQKLPRQVRLQLIEIKASAAIPKPEAREKIEAIHNRLQQGERFDRLALAESEDLESRSSGGMLGWRNEDSPGLENAANKAIAKLAIGQVSGILEGKDSFTLIKLLGRRQGDLSLAQAEEEIGEDLYKTEESIRLAKEEAVSYIKRAQVGEKLAEMFTSEEKAKADEQTAKTETTGNESEQADEKEKNEGDKGAKKEAKEKEVKIKEQTGSRPTPSPLKLMSTSLFSRSGRHIIPGIGVSAEGTAAAFKLKKGEVAAQPFVVEQTVYLVACAERRDPLPDEWNKRKEELTEELASRKWAQGLRDYAYQRCDSALQDKRVYVNSKALLTPGYSPDPKDPPLARYVPCHSLKEVFY